MVAFLDEGMLMPSGGPSQLQSIDGSVSRSPMHPKASILVVDDEPAVLRVLVTRLQLAGYRVFSAQDGEEALSGMDGKSMQVLIIWQHGVIQFMQQEMV